MWVNWDGGDLFPRPSQTAGRATLEETGGETVEGTRLDPSGLSSGVFLSHRCRSGVKFRDPKSLLSESAISAS